jgi:hypothetical protein
VHGATYAVKFRNRQGRYRGFCLFRHDRELAIRPALGLVRREALRVIKALYDEPLPLFAVSFVEVKRKGMSSAVTS